MSATEKLTSSEAKTILLRALRDFLRNNAGALMTICGDDAGLRAPRSPNLLKGGPLTIIDGISDKIAHAITIDDLDTLAGFTRILREGPGNPSARSSVAHDYERSVVALLETTYDAELPELIAIRMREFLQHPRNSLKDGWDRLKDAGCNFSDYPDRIAKVQALLDIFERCKKKESVERFPRLASEENIAFVKQGSEHLRNLYLAFQSMVSFRTKNAKGDIGNLVNDGFTEQMANELKAVCDKYDSEIAPNLTRYLELAMIAQSQQQIAV